MNFDIAVSAFITALPSSLPTPSAGSDFSMIRTAQDSCASAAALSPALGVGIVIGFEPNGG